MTTWKDDRSNPEPKKRPAPQMPEGYYSGDKPNPHLREFVEKNMTAYDPEHDEYQVEPFNEAITTTKATAIYNMHTYWSKKPHDAIRQYIRHYTKPGDIVLDPFCGSGGTALAALIEGRKAIAIDRSPAATFITKNYCTPVDVDELQAAFEELKEKVKPEIDWLYETRCDRCGGKATTAYTVYSQRFRCPRCLETVALFDCPEVEGRTLKGTPKKMRVCPHCQKGGHQEEISTSGEKSGAVPVLVSYICENGCKPARSERKHDDFGDKKDYYWKYDMSKIQEVEIKKISYWLPNNRMMNANVGSGRWGLLWRPYLAGRENVIDFFRYRNLFALSCILSNIKDLNCSENLKDAMLFTFSSMLLNVSDMYQYRDSGKGGFSKGTYYIAPIFQVMNVWRSFEDKFSDMKRAYKNINIQLNNFFLNISCETAIELNSIKNNSVDYIFTDPPYSWKVQFGEANFIWESWLGFDTYWHNDEIIINDFRRFTEDFWAQRMKYAMKQCYRILKPGRWISLCYHDTSEGTWKLVQDIMAEVGFLINVSGAAIFIDTDQKSWKQLVADKVTKRDLVINFRKPFPEEAGHSPKITELDDFGTFQGKVRIIISDYLADHPGSTKDRIYDEVVSRMVRKGQMEAHHFEDLLSQVAEPVQPEGGRMAHWYLKEETQGQDEAETRKEDAAAAIISRRISELLAKNPEAEGVHYSDLFEHYLYAVKDKPRRMLAELLSDYYYKNLDGTWRLPADEDEAHLKQEGRAAGLSRSIKRYLSYLEQNIPVPEKERPSEATLADWIRHAKRSGLYSEGKLLYEKGGLRLDRLSEEGQVNVDEDYMVCTRMLSRKVEGKGKR